MKLMAKVIIKGQIKTITGLHIGSDKNSLDIGGLANSVIKDSQGRPYIPGSSLKGKMRCLLEREVGVPEILNGETNPKFAIYTSEKLHKTGVIAKIFGIGASENNNLGPTRFYARDAYLSEESAELMETKDGKFRELEMDYTESKMENVIDRFSSKANHPRTMERVPAGAYFDFEFVYNVFGEGQNTTDSFEKITEGMQLLEDDYIGGSGSRGYGQIKFLVKDVFIKDAEFYKNGTNSPALKALEDKVTELKNRFTGE